MAEETQEILSEEDEYAKVETEKLLRKKKKQRIWTIASLVCAFALAVVIIVLSVVPANLRPACVEANFQTIEFFTNSQSDGNGKIDKSDENMNANYDKFVKAFNDSFAQPYIAAIFSGTMSQYKIDETFSDFSTAKNALKTQAYVVLKYAEDKTFTNKNGDIYKTIAGSTLTFREVYLTINSQAEFADVTLYFNMSYSTGATAKLVKLTVKADTSKIYKAFEDLF